MERVWIYQADRDLTSAEAEAVGRRLADFMPVWAAHGKKLKASYEILHDRFIILKADESHEMPSGCSIDESVRVIREIEKEFGLSLFDRTKMAYLDGGGIKTCSLSEIKELYFARQLTDSTPVFDISLTSAKEMNTRWQVPLKESGYYAFVS